MADSAIQAAIAANRIPATVSLDNLYENSDNSTIAALISICVIASILVSCRAISRFFIVKSFGLDDGLAVLGTVLMVAFTTLGVLFINLGTARHFEYIEYVMTPEEVERSQYFDFIAHGIFMLALLICRFSGLMFYRRICRQHNKFLTIINVSAVFFVCGFLVQIFLYIFQCSPVTVKRPYPFEPRSAEYTCLSWVLVYYVAVVPLLCSDLLLFGLPVAIISNLEVSRTYKMQLGSIILPGVLVIGILIGRTVFMMQSQLVDADTWAYNTLLIIETSEIAATLVALSIPGIKPLFDYARRRKPAPPLGSSKPPRELETIQYGLPIPSADTSLQNIRASLRSLQTSITPARYLEDSDDDRRSTDSLESILIQLDLKSEDRL